MSRACVPDIRKASGIDCPVESIEECGGGCISTAYTVKTTNGVYFVKIQCVDFLPNFQAEFFDLEKIAATESILCPTPLFTGIHDSHSYLVMTYLPNLKEACPEIGAALARMHLHGRAEMFGFPVVTFCGSAVLDNTMTDEPWSEWFARHRIGKIIEMIGVRRITRRSLEHVVARVIDLLKSHDREATPSIVHGDLWCGNGASSDGRLCVFDPGCYYGDPYVDLALTELFGGFGTGIYDPYETVTRICDGYHRRKIIYTIYSIY